MLAGFAEECGLPPDAQLTDKLLTLDREEVATLERDGERPSPGEVVLQYNRGAVRTLLAHAARVVFRLRQVPGATLKRTYFVAKRRGVYVDIEREAGGYTVLLYGPESATGGADRYGARLADVSLSLLRSLLGEVGGEAFGGATAYLVMHDREYRFHLTPELLVRLEYEPKAESSASGNRVAERGVAYSVGGTVDGSAEAEGDEPLFDSLVEAKLYREFKSLERQGYTNGWQMLREPDPLLAPGAVMIPDFAFRRGEACVYMEIVGFWSPGYREKKLQKLRLLSGSSPDTALILAVPRENAEAYGGLPFPVAPYKTGVRSTDLLTLLNTRYGGRESREEGAQERLGELRSAALSRGFVREQEVADTLQAYSRTELLSAVRDLSDDEVVYVAGIGLMTRKMLAGVEAGLRDALQVSDNKLLLEDAERIASEALGDRADVESLLSALPNLQIERPSLFEAYLVGV
jgi:predicted nuclease of restriction endonuclease-like RecB superfamily